MREALRNRQSVRSIARGVIEEGHCAHLKPKTVERYVTLLRDALGLPGYAEQQAAVEQVEREDQAAEEPIEGQSALSRLRWLARKQQARVRKALHMEGLMHNMVLPMATTEIKLMGDLLEKEFEITLKAGELKPVPPAPSLEGTGLEITTPAEAFRVLLACQRIKAILLAQPHPEGENHALTPGGAGRGAESGDGRSLAPGGAGVAEAVPRPADGDGAAGPGAPGGNPGLEPVR